MIILVEGNEGTGKTTLINELVKNHSIIAVKISKECENLYDFYDYLLNSPHLFVLDRGFVTDLVYRIWDKGKGQVNLHQLSNLFVKDKVKIIFCYHRNSYENSIKRGEDVIKTQKEHNLISTLFGNVRTILHSFTEVETFDYNYEYQSVDDVINFIKGGE